MDDDDDDDDDGVQEARDYNHYIDKLFSYLLALAISGSVPVQPPPQEQESIGADSTRFALVPLDVVYAYYWRAKRAAQAVPAASRLAWLERVDTAERAVWVSEFRDSDKGLGTVINEVFTQRDAHWEANVAAPPISPHLSKLSGSISRRGSRRKQSSSHLDLDTRRRAMRMPKRYSPS